MTTRLGLSTWNDFPAFNSRTIPHIRVHLARAAAAALGVEATLVFDPD
jgi:hypothetical protein